MEKYTDLFKSLFLLILATLVAWNVYTGLTLQSLELPGLFKIEFGDGEAPSGNDPSSSEDNNSTGFRVVEAMLRADPFDYTGPCPVRITFSGRISAVGGSGTVAYKFIRSDNASAPVQTLTFASPGSHSVTETWTLGGSGVNWTEWEAIQILDPQEIQSNRAEFTIRCD